MNKTVIKYTNSTTRGTIINLEPSAEVYAVETNQTINIVIEQRGTESSHIVRFEHLEDGEMCIHASGQQVIWLFSGGKEVEEIDPKDREYYKNS